RGVDALQLAARTTRLDRASAVVQSSAGIAARKPDLTADRPRAEVLDLLFTRELFIGNSKSVVPVPLPVVLSHPQHVDPFDYRVAPDAIRVSPRLGNQVERSVEPTEIEERHCEVAREDRGERRVEPSRERECLLVIIDATQVAECDLRRP